MVQEEIIKFEKKLDIFETKIYKFEEKTMKLQCNISEKTRAVQDEVAYKITSGHLNMKKFCLS